MRLSGDVAIIGAGLIGLAVAHELARRGATVRVFERDLPGRAASWAGAGMLAPYTERMNDDALARLCAQSLALYPGFVADIEATSGVGVHLHLDGIVNAAFDDVRMDELRRDAERLRANGVACDVLDRSGAMLAEPSLGRHVFGAIAVEGEGAVDNRRLGRALTAACESAGVAIVRDARDVAVECDARRVLGVRSNWGFAGASHVVVAAGAWSASLPGLPVACEPPLEPIKGQMLALAMPRGFLKRTTWVPGAYLVPRDDGRLLVGATVERAGFDQRVTADGVRSLLDAALDAAPALGDFAVTETWAGLRPGTPDERPILGPTSVDGLILATGHYRNGILLTPVTARLIADFVERGDRAVLEPWLLARFEKEGAATKRMSKP
ncbi:MAG: glycine oxidase ThiO [Candidatus Eremiobacteraeota bacterium]|nr:glycine oxidase ThiO [Candidatus Eremiobacteraeota bacterium]